MITFKHFEPALIEEEKTLIILERKRRKNAVMIGICSIVAMIFVLYFIGSGQLAADIGAGLFMICIVISILMIQACIVKTKHLKKVNTMLQRFNHNYYIEIEEDATISIHEPNEEVIQVLYAKEAHKSNDGRTIIVRGEMKQGNKSLKIIEFSSMFAHIEEIIEWLKINKAQHDLQQLKNQSLRKILQLPQQDQDELLIEELKECRLLLCVSYHVKDVFIINKNQCDFYTCCNEGYLQLYASKDEIDISMKQQCPIVFTTKLEDILELDESMQANVFEQEEGIKGVQIHVGDAMITLAMVQIKQIVGV